MTTPETLDVGVWTTALQYSDRDAHDLGFLLHGPDRYYRALKTLLKYFARPDQWADQAGLPVTVREQAARAGIAHFGTCTLSDIARDARFFMGVNGEEPIGAVVANQPAGGWSRIDEVHIHLVHPGATVVDFKNRARALLSSSSGLDLVAYFPGDEALGASSVEMNELRQALKLPPMASSVSDGAFYENVEDLLAQCDVTFAPGTHIRLTLERDPSNILGSSTDDELLVRQTRSVVNVAKHRRLHALFPAAARNLMAEIYETGAVGEIDQIVRSECAKIVGRRKPCTYSDKTAYASQVFEAPRTISPARLN
ncbi:MAG: hypothetical protein HOQ05_13335 [Corynebacteriales bacterium]|nr:hypothetical protein [Mycobacteriales bacterium]